MDFKLLSVQQLGSFLRVRKIPGSDLFFPDEAVQNLFGKWTLLVFWVSASFADNNYPIICNYFCGLMILLFFKYQCALGLTILKRLFFA